MFDIKHVPGCFSLKWLMTYCSCDTSEQCVIMWGHWNHFIIQEFSSPSIHPSIHGIKWTSLPPANADENLSTCSNYVFCQVRRQQTGLVAWNHQPGPVPMEQSAESTGLDPTMASLTLTTSCLRCSLCSSALPWRAGSKFSTTWVHLHKISYFLSFSSCCHYYLQLLLSNLLFPCKCSSESGSSFIFLGCLVMIHKR